MTKKILVLCTGNSARSQMGEGLFRAEGGGGFEIFSAGTKPSFVRPEAIAVMKEIGIDLSGHRSKSVDEFSGQSIDYVVTVCDNARDNCPAFPAGAERTRWSFGDPSAGRGPVDPVAQGSVLKKRRRKPLDVGSAPTASFTRRSSPNSQPTTRRE